MVNGNVPVAVGMPLMMPLDGANSSPAGVNHRQEPRKGRRASVHCKADRIRDSSRGVRKRVRTHGQRRRQDRNAERFSGIRGTSAAHA